MSGRPENEFRFDYHHEWGWEEASFTSLSARVHPLLLNLNRKNTTFPPLENVNHKSSFTEIALNFVLAKAKN
jgi:hypothetical protein